MKNLENFEVQELNSGELKENNGGFIGWFASAIAGSFVYGVIEDWDGNVAAFKDAYNQAR